MNSLFVDPKGQLDDIIIENEGTSPLLFAFFEDACDRDIRIRVKGNASVKIALADFSRGKGETRVSIDLDEPGASAEFHAAVLSSGDDRKTVLANCFHHAHHTDGLIENYGIAEGNSRLSFLGKSDISKGAYGSKTRQSAKIIVFDERCVAQASPILCIDENDVQASHAAVVGKLNEEHIYYLLSRGLSLADARRLISLGYLKPIEAFFEGETRTRIEEAIERGI